MGQTSSHRAAITTKSRIAMMDKIFIDPKPEWNDELISLGMASLRKEYQKDIERIEKGTHLQFNGGTEDFLPEAFSYDYKQYYLFFNNEPVPAIKRGPFYEVADPHGPYRLWKSVSNPFSIRVEKEIAGERHLFVPLQSSWVAKCSPEASNWQLWLNVENDANTVKAVIYDITGSRRLGFISSEGMLQLDSDPLILRRYTDHFAEKPLIFDFLTPICIQEKDADGKIQDLLEFRNLYDEEQQKPLKLVKIEDRWHFKHDLFYYVAADQKLEGLNLQNRCLILQNNQGERLALIPVCSYSTLVREKIPGPFSYMALQLAPDGSIDMQNTSYKNAFVAYHIAMQARLPEDSVKCLKFIKAAWGFYYKTAEQLRVYSWILPLFA